LFEYLTYNPTNFAVHSGRQMFMQHLTSGMGLYSGRGSRGLMSAVYTWKRYFLSYYCS